MGWPTIPPALVASDYVTIQRAGTWSQDPSGGKVRNLGSPSSPRPCSVAAVKTKAASNHAVNYRDTEVAQYVITFANVNPKLHRNDQLNWLNEGKTLFVTRTVTDGPSDARMWLAYAEERPAV